MRRIRRLVAPAALLGLVGGLLLSSSALAQSASPSAKTPIVFTEGTINDIKTVNPFKALETPEYEVLSLNYDMLLNFDKKTLAASPGLATEVPSADNGGMSSDGMTWTFHIRDNAVWQDGQPVTAKDIAFTFNTVIDDKFGNSLDYLPFTDSITAPDDTTLVWKTTKPTTAPIRPPWIYIIPEHVFSSWSADQLRKWPGFEDGKPPIGSGPFQMTSWTQGESWSMTANKQYWAGAPQIDQFVVKKYNNAEAMVSALKRGEIDYIGSVPVDLFNSLSGQESQGITTHVGPATGFSELAINMCDATSPDAAPYCQKNPGTGNPILRDPQVRLAMAYAIDRNTLVNSVLQTYGSPGTTIVPPFATTYHWEPPADQLVSFDIQKANQILDAAGYKDTNGDGIREAPNGDPMDFRLILRSESDVGAKVGKYITGWLKQIGIKTEPVVLTDGKLIDAWYANDYDLYVWGWGPDPDPDFILSTFTSGQCGGWSDTCFSDPTYDQLYKEQAQAITISDRQQIINQMQQIIYQQNPEIILYYDKSLEAFRSDRWTGLDGANDVSPQPDGFIWNQYTPYTALTVAPLGTGGTSAASSGVSPLVWLGILLAIIVVGGVIVLARRGGRADEDAA
jgi:peptide/nickel transport system substrate-binding protein